MWLPEPKAARPHQLPNMEFCLYIASRTKNTVRLDLCIIGIPYLVCKGLVGTKKDPRSTGVELKLD